MRTTMTAVRRIGSIVAATLLLASCKVGPDYQTPQVLPTHSWSQGAQGPISNTDADLREWWKRFNDPVLNQLIAQAEESNASIERALASVRVSLGALGVSESEYWPSISTGVLYSREQTNASLIPSQGVDTSPFSVWAAGIAMTSWEIDVWGRVARLVEASAAKLEATVEDLHDALISVRGQVGTTYMRVRTLQTQLGILETAIANARTTYELTKAKRTAGTATQLDLNEAQQDLETIEAEIPQVEADLAASIFAIAQLCGTTPEPIVRILSTRAAVPTGPPSVGIGMPTELLRRRPDVRGSERRAAAAVATVGATEALNLPIFSLTGNFYLASTEFNSMFDGSNLTYSFGPSVRWLIFQGGYVESLIAQSKGQAQVALAAYRETVLNAVRDVETSISSVVQAQRAVESYSEAVALAQQTFELAQLQYSAGTVDLDRLVTIQNNLLEVQKDLATSQGDLATGFVSLYRSLGGGWEQDTVSDKATASAAGKDST